MIGKFFKDYSGFLLSAGVDFPGTLIPDVELIVFGAHLVAEWSLDWRGQPTLVARNKPIAVVQARGDRPS